MDAILLIIHTDIQATSMTVYYISCRMYDPETGRFMQEDTYTGKTNDPLSLNLYTYCKNEPLIYNDPTGHSLKNIFESVVNKIINTGVELIVNPIGTIERAIGYIGNKLSDFISGAKNVVSKITSVLCSTCNNIENIISNIKKSVSNSIKNIVGQKINSLKRFTAKVVNDIKKIGKNIDKGAEEREEKALNSPYDFVNYATFGISGSINSGLADRYAKKDNSTYDFWNWLTCGIVGMVKGAVDPDKPLSKEHWLDSIGLATLIVGGTKFVTDGAVTDGFTDGAAEAEFEGPDLKIDDNQFGRKVGKHAEDYGLDEKDPNSRQWVRNHINDIADNPNEVREGT